MREGPTTPAAGVTPLPMDDFEEAPLLVELRDGRLLAICSRRDGGGTAVVGRVSADGGARWGPEQRLLALRRGTGGWCCAEALAARDGSLHLFLLNDDRTGVIDAGEAERPGTGQMPPRRLDIWHARSGGDLRGFGEPRPIWRGYTGALNSVVELASGRILLPFSFLTDRSWRNRGGGLGEYTFLGRYDATALWSDDGGERWTQAGSLRVPVPDITYAYGAVEPVAVELGDGRIWMLIRTQMGRFYQSFSPDGRSWSAPSPTRILSSDSPAGLAGLADGRIVLLWNNCLRYPYAYGGRQILHAALSLDGGRRWRGFREVARDPSRGEPPPPSGDFGTAYPFPVATRDGRLVFRSGQGRGRTMVCRLEPDWLLETHRSADFLREPEAWSLFGTKGVDIVEAGGSRMLRIRRVDAEFPACAVWSFPAGDRGELRIDTLLAPGCRGLAVSLTDHFSAPFDGEAELHAVATACLASREDRQTLAVPAGRWCEVRLRWDGPSGPLRVSVDGRERAPCPLLRSAERVSYLRLRAAAEDAEEGAALVRSVHADTAWEEGGACAY